MDKDIQGNGGLRVTSRSDLSWWWNIFAVFKDDKDDYTGTDAKGWLKVGIAE